MVQFSFNPIKIKKKCHHNNKKTHIIINMDVIGNLVNNIKTKPREIPYAINPWNIKTPPIRRRNCPKMPQTCVQRRPVIRVTSTIAQW